MHNLLWGFGLCRTAVPHVFHHDPMSTRLIKYRSGGSAPTSNTPEALNFRLHKNRVQVSKTGATAGLTSLRAGLGSGGTGKVSIF